MTVRTIDDIFRDFVIEGMPASGPFNPYKPDIRDTLKKLLEGLSTFPDNRVIRLNNANEGTANNIVVSSSVAIPSAAYQVLYVLNVTQANTGAVTVSGAINRALVTNTSQPVPNGYLKPGMAVLCIDTGSTLRMLSYGNVESIVEEMVVSAEAAKAAAELARDQAQNAASDAVSQSNVPIYSSRDAIETLVVPVAINAFRTNGYSAAGDKALSLYLESSTEPAHFSKVQDGEGRWFQAVEEDDRLRSFAVSMFNAQPVKIDCFGDSTMVGVDVTNPPDYIAAIPAPAKLQMFLRDYYSNGSIDVNNKAISGTRTVSMLAGTDGSGKTFRERISESDADIVFCNHGINDCQNTPPTPIGDYKANLFEIVRIIRAAGKIPVLMTPNVLAPVPSLGVIDKSERLKSYAEVVREVCRTDRVALVDAFQQTWQLLTCGRYKVQQILPDGVHPTQLAYNYIGQLMAAPFMHPQQGVSTDGEIVSVASPTVLITPYNPVSAAVNSRTGMQLISSTDNVAKSIKMLIKIEKPGLDLFLAYPIWIGGVEAAGVGLDQVYVGGISQRHSAGYGGRYIQDHEICVARNVPPGLHMVSISADASTWSIGANYLRVRNSTSQELRFKNAGPHALLTYTEILGKALLSVSNGNSDAIEITDQIHLDRFSGPLDIGFTAAFNKGDAVCIFGQWAANATDGVAVMGLGVGCDETTGYLTIFQANGEGAYSKTAIGSADISGQSKDFRVYLAAGSPSSLQVWVDGVGSVGATVSVPFLGGFFGIRKSGNGLLSVNKLSTLR